MVSNNQLAFFRILVNGVEATSLRVSTYINEIHTVAVSAKISGVASGSIIKIQYNTAGGTHTVYGRNMNIDGILDTNVKT